MRGPRPVPVSGRKRELAAQIRKLAANIDESHPEMGTGTHLRDAARVLESGQTHGAIRHLQTAAHSFTPQSLYRHGIATDDGHTAARRHTYAITAHILRIKDVQDTEARNLAKITRTNSETSTEQSGAVNVTPLVRSAPSATGGPFGPAAMNAPTGPLPTGGAKGVAPGPKSPPQAASRQWAAANPPPTSIDLVGPKGYTHGWHYVGGPGLPLPAPTQGYTSGLRPGSFEHLRAIENMADLAGNPPGDPEHRSDVMQVSLHHLAHSVAARDMKGARIHLASAKWGNRHQAGGLWTRDLAALGRQLDQVPKGVSYRKAAPNPLSYAGQHPGTYKGRGIVADPTAGSMGPPMPTAVAAAMPADTVRALLLSAETGRLAVTPAPRGRPGGPGLYDVKGLGHTPYLQNVVKALIRKGMDPHKAYAVARGSIRRWAAKSKHPEVRSAAAGAEAGELRKQAQARAVHGHAADTARALELVGPKGFIHGWLKIGTAPSETKEAEDTSADKLPKGLQAVGKHLGPMGEHLAADHPHGHNMDRKKVAAMTSEQQDAYHAAQHKFDRAEHVHDDYAVAAAAGADCWECVIELVGTAAGAAQDTRTPSGKFGKAGQAPAKGKPGKGKPGSGAAGKQAAAAVAQRKAALLKTAHDDRAKAKALMVQLAALTSASKKATKKTASATKAGATGKAASSTPAKKAATAKAAAGKPAKPGAKKPSKAQQITALRTQIAGLLAAANAAQAQAAKL